MNSEQEEHARLMNDITALQLNKTDLSVKLFDLLEAAKAIVDKWYGFNGNGLPDAPMINKLAAAISRAEGAE